MNASKENCRRAQELFDLIAYDELSRQEDDSLFVQSFLMAAEKRLPSEATISKDKDRRKVKK